MRSVSLFLANFLNFIFFPFLERIPGKFLSVQLEKVQQIEKKVQQIEKMVSLVARTGRQLQRYDKDCRQVVGCVPYRYRKTSPSSSIEELEVLVISSQKGQGMLFPKGGWEIDESMEDAASRETREEAGVTGDVERRLPRKWTYKSKRDGRIHEGYMFPLLVKEELDNWPEINFRKRRWVTVTEAREVCQNWWMREALDELVRRKKEENETTQK